VIYISNDIISLDYCIKIYKKFLKSKLVSIFFCNFGLIFNRCFNTNDMNRIKVVLAEKNIQSKWISEQLGVSQATVSKWVNNTSQPSLEMIEKLAKILDIDYTELLRIERKSPLNESK